MPRATPWLLVLSAVTAAASQPAKAPLYSVVLASSSVPAFHYPFVHGSTLIGFRGTALESGASGQAVVRGDGGRMRIHAHLRGLPPAHRFGPEYFTYVLWAISPLGRPVNLGEVVAVRGRAHLEAISNLQSFGLIVTAEPHFAVTRVSNAVVMQNEPLRGTRPAVEEAEARLDLLTRASYPVEGGPAPEPMARTASPYVLQARNAVRIAQAEQADTLAPSEFRLAQDQLDRMEGEKRATALEVAARRAVLLAEEARIVAERHGEAQRLAREQETSADLRGRLETAQAQVEAARTLATLEAQRAHAQERAATEARRKATEAQLAVRRSLVAQLNRLLQTRETEEGLQATLTDVAFPTGSSRLAAPARVNLAKIAGILLGRPGLKIRVLGHTDATGSPAVNDRLSLQRALSVRRFLEEQGIPSAHLLAEGMASTHPVDSNLTPQGRSRNRRVDLVVSGEPIGI